MRTREYDDWTIDRWRVEPKRGVLDFFEDKPADVAPPLWKDLALASMVALAFWIGAAMLFG